MQSKYGSYSFDANTTQVTVLQGVEKNRADVPYLLPTSIHVRGRLYGTSQSELATKEAALKTALAVPFQDFVFLQDSGARSAVYLLNRNCVGGVYVSDGPNFESVYGAEYATIREFTFTVFGRLPVVNVATVLFSFEETMDYQGGGPEYVFKRAVNGPPQKQLGWFQTEYVLLQRGSAVGFLAYPTPPSPAFPGALRRSPNVRRKAPQRIGNSYINFEISWDYEMASSGPLPALPNIWR